MSWETEKRKLNKSNEKFFIHDRNLNRQKIYNKKIDNRIDNLNRSEGIISKLYDLSQEWEQLNSLNGVFNSITNKWDEDTNWSEQGFSKDIEFDVFDIRLLPYIKVNYIFKPVEQIDNKKVLQWVNSGIFYSIKDIIGYSNEFFKNVTLHLMCNIDDFRPEGDQGDYLLQRPWKVKTIISLVNPRLFI